VCGNDGCPRNERRQPTGHRRVKPDPVFLYFGNRKTFQRDLPDRHRRPARRDGSGRAQTSVRPVGNALKAIDYKPCKVKWSRPFAMVRAGHEGGTVGLLSHAGGLRSERRTAAISSRSDEAERQARCGTPASGKRTRATDLRRNCLDGRQDIVVRSGDALYAFAGSREANAPHWVMDYLVNG